MMIHGITSATPAPTSRLEGLGEESTEVIGPVGAEPTDGVSDVFGNLVVQAATASRDASMKADLLARGAHDDLHGTMIAAKEAEISVKLVGTIRNKLIDAFQELWRTNV